MLESAELLNIKQASLWATAHIGKTVTPSNIAYLINYGRVPKIGDNGGTLIAKQDLIEHYTHYAYDLFGYERRADSIAKILRNARKFLAH